MKKTWLKFFMHREECTGRDISLTVNGIVSRGPIKEITTDGEGHIFIHRSWAACHNGFDWSIDPNNAPITINIGSSPDRDPEHRGDGTVHFSTILQGHIVIHTREDSLDRTVIEKKPVRVG